MGWGIRDDTNRSEGKKVDWAQREGELCCTCHRASANPRDSCQMRMAHEVTLINSEFPGLCILAQISNWIWAPLGRMGPWVRKILRELAARGPLLLEEGSGQHKPTSSTG